MYTLPNLWTFFQPTNSIFLTYRSLIFLHQRKFNIYRQLCISTANGFKNLQRSGTKIKSGKKSALRLFSTAIRSLFQKMFFFQNERRSCSSSQLLRYVFHSSIDKEKLMLAGKRVTSRQLIRHKYSLQLVASMRRVLDDCTNWINIHRHIWVGMRTDSDRWMRIMWTPQWVL